MNELVSARARRLRAALEDGDFDALLVASPANVAYASGYRSVAGGVFRHHQMAAVVTPSSLVLACPAADTAAALDAGVTDVVTFGRFYFETASPDRLAAVWDGHDDLPDAIRAALRRAGVDAGTLGVDLEGLGASRSAVEDALPDGLRVLDASSWCTGLRAVKLPAEVERLQASACLAERGIDRAIALAAVGTTEQELATAVADAMVEGGGVPRFVVVTSGERSALSDAHASGRELRPGDLLRFDVGCELDGYWSDVGRTAVVGDPSARQSAYYDAILAGEQAQLELARPGVTAVELFEVAVRTVEEHGVEPYRRHHCGHGIGTEVYEPPIISPAFRTPLEEGMTFCFETPFYELGWGGMMVEDTLVVTGGGIEMLTSLDRSLRVVPA